MNNLPNYNDPQLRELEDAISSLHLVIRDVTKCQGEDGKVAVEYLEMAISRAMCARASLRCGRL